MVMVSRLETGTSGDKCRYTTNIDERIIPGSLVLPQYVGMEIKRNELGKCAVKIAYEQCVIGQGELNPYCCIDEISIFRVVPDA